MERFVLARSGAQRSPSTSAANHLLSIISIVFLVVACSERRLSVAERCEQVRDRLVALEIPRADPHREAHARVMRRALGNEFIERCSRSMTDVQRDCVL